MLNKPSLDDRSVLLLGAETFHRQPDRYVFTGHGTFTCSMRMAPEIAQLGHRQIDIDTVDAGKCVDGSTTPFILSREERLSNFHGAGEGGEEGRSAASGAIAKRSGCEGSAFPRLDRKC